MVGTAGASPKAETCRDDPAAEARLVRCNEVPRGTRVDACAALNGFPLPLAGWELQTRAPCRSSAADRLCGSASPGTAWQPCRAVGNMAYMPCCVHSIPQAFRWWWVAFAGARIPLDGACSRLASSRCVRSWTLLPAGQWAGIPVAALPQCIAQPGHRTLQQRCSIQYMVRTPPVLKWWIGKRTSCRRNINARSGGDGPAGASFGGEPFSAPGTSRGMQMGSMDGPAACEEKSAEN